MMQKECKKCYTTDIPISPGRGHCILCEKERRRANAAIHREKYPEQTKKAHIEYVKNNRQKVRDKHKRWRDNNPAKIKEYYIKQQIKLGKIPYKLTIKENHD